METLYYDAPSNTSRDDDDEEEDPKNCFKIAQNRVCCTLGYIYKVESKSQYFPPPSSAWDIVQTLKCYLLPFFFGETQFLQIMP